MDQNQFAGLVRTALAFIGGFIVNSGLLTSSGWEWIAGGLTLFIPAVWSFIKNRPASIAAKAQGLPGVEVTASASAGADVVKAVAAAK